MTDQTEKTKSSRAILKHIKRNLVKEKIDTAVVHDFKDSDFKKALTHILTTRGSLQKEVCDKLLDEQGIAQLKIAFTHPSMLESANYELYETLGDSTVNKCIVWYMTRRFPSIKRGERGNETITELKKTFVDKKSFVNRFNQLKLKDFIRYKELVYLEKNVEKTIILDNSMKEDVFESFLGALEDLIDSRIFIHTGYSVIYNIISSLLDEEQNISLNLADILDAKTKILEIFSSRKKFGDTIEFKQRSSDSETNLITSSLTLSFSGNTELKGPTKPLVKEFIGRPDLKLQRSEFDAAEQALDWFKKEYGIEWSRRN
jgi:dsRNA-specific ribonuclease